MLVEQSDPFSERVAFPVVDGIVRTFMSIMPTSMIGRSQKWLVTAGDKMSLPQFMTTVLIWGTAIPAAAFVMVWIASGGSLPGAMIVVLPLLAVVGLAIPFFLLRRSARKRKQVIWRSMPNALDLLTTCVEAGLSLDFGLQRVADKYPGPLADEIQRALREMGLGKPRRDALLDMGTRIDLPDVSTFINSIVQAEALGTSVGQVLRVQAAQMRLKRRQKAEQVAHRAPVKMVFPLVLFLMPSLFIVTLGPVILNVIKAFQEA